MRRIEGGARAVRDLLGTAFVVKHMGMDRRGSYWTWEQILTIYDMLQLAIDTGEPYQTLLNPPPADPRVAHDIATKSPAALDEGLPK